MMGWDESSKSMSRPSSILKLLWSTVSEIPGVSFVFLSSSLLFAIWLGADNGHEVMGFTNNKKPLRLFYFYFPTQTLQH